MILMVQFVTGVLLTFYYVPSADHAHTTVSFMEKALPVGSWIRALHHHGSQWLSFFLLLHLLELFWREAYRANAGRWAAAVLLLALAMAAGATGYSLPWDLRAFFSTRVAEGIVGGLPLIGRGARTWLLGANEISTLTISRFFALHVLVTPFLILLVVVWQVLVHKSKAAHASPGDQFSVAQNEVEKKDLGIVNQLTRNAVVALFVFVLLGIYAYKFRAPLGPAASNAAANYLPRPGAQFVWLYQTLKYVPGALGSLVGVMLPGVVLLILVALPWLDRIGIKRAINHPRRRIGAAILSMLVIFITSMTVISYVSDRRDPRARQQLARQAADEQAFHREPFVPALLQENNDNGPAPIASPGRTVNSPPASYAKLCATCHGEHGEGARQGPLKFPPLLGVAEKPHRSVADIISLLNDPTAYGLQPPMKSFATKLNEDEKREIAEWVVTLKKTN
jgi:ubiquinol-cytochrome c reductase cytochrome b subunit